MQVSAVKVSLTAGESARMAISTSWSMAKTGSCMSVRWGPVTCALASARRHLAGRAPRPDRRERPAGDDEVTGPVVEADDGICAVGDLDELGVADELQVPARVGGHRAALSSMQRSSSAQICRCPRLRRAPGLRARRRELGVDGASQVAGDAGDDLGQLDRLGDVVDEVDEHGEVDEQQRFGDGDRQVGDEVAVRAAVIEPSASTE